VKGDAVAEVDITRFITPQIALELVLATAGQEVMAGGSSLGTVNHLPPTLSLQYHLLESARFRPYVGAGANYTNFYRKSGGLSTLDLDHSFGWAAQVGTDVMLTGRTSVNVDAKYVNIETDVKSGGTTAYHLKINPILLGLGLGYRF
jgi:outer membrane protein